jgi:hypothetical protein
MPTPVPFLDLLSSSVSSFQALGLDGVLIAVAMMAIVGLVFRSFHAKGG